MGVIYVLTNPSFPEYVKIGYADNLEQRLKHLNNSECIPFAFRVHCIYEVNERLKDKDVHALIDKINPDLRSIDEFDGKKRIREFYSISAEDAYDILYSIAAISGTTDRLKLMTPEGHEMLDEKIANEIRDSSDIVYTEEGLLSNASEKTKSLYYSLKRKITELNGICVEPKKLYIAFKSSTNICDITAKKNKLKVFINMSKGTLLDPTKITTDMSNTGHWGNGDYMVEIEDELEIFELMKLIKQSYDAKIK